MSESVVILSGVRTAIGTFGGSLSGYEPAQLGALVAAEALKRADVQPEAVGHVVFGNVIPTSPRDAYLSRVAAVTAGIPKETPAMNVNRLCGSGAQAVVSAAQSIMLGDAQVALAGGSEVMSRAPHYLQTGRFGQKMGDTTLIDGLTGTLMDPFGHGLMGITAENISEQCSISRGDQDEYAAESQRRAAAAIMKGRFKEQILPIEVSAGRKTFTFDTDEYPKGETTADSLGGLSSSLAIFSGW